MTIQLFNEEEDISLKEYSEDPNYEDYAGIVLDKDKNQFRVITGKFTDKKDFYEKMADRGLILRKCFEIRVYNWIKENARTTLDAYLMLSTAFSKWKGNNMLSGYYNKLLKDIPELNREGQKGNPNTRGKKEESTLTEDNAEVEVLFKDSSLPSKYKEALAIDDPLQSAIGLIKADLVDRKISLEDIKHSTKQSLTYNLNKELEKLKNPEKYIPNHGKIDPETLSYQHSQLSKLNASKYSLTISPAIGHVEKVLSVAAYSTNNTTPAEKKILLPVPEGEDKSLMVNVPQVYLYNYEGGLNLLQCLQNPYVLKAISDVKIEALNKYGSNKAVGVYINVYIPIGSSKSDVITSGKNVTDTLSNSVMRYKDANVDIYDSEHNLIDKNINVNYKLTDHGVFVSNNAITKIQNKLKSDSKYTRNDFDDKYIGTIEKANLLLQANRANGYIADKFFPDASQLMRRRYFLYNEINKSLKNISEDNPSYIQFKNQMNFLNSKRTQILNIPISESKEFIIKRGATHILNDMIIPIVKDDYFNKLIDQSEYANEIKQINGKLAAVDNEFEKQEILDTANFANISKVDQAAFLHDKLMRVRDAQFNGNPLYGDKDGKLYKKKDDAIAKSKAEPKQEIPEELRKKQKLENALKTAKDDLHYWNYMFKKGSDKDKREAEKQILVCQEKLENAQQAYDNYITSEEYINYKNAHPEEQKEAYVNDGASSYFRDQQAASKDALKGTITEETTHSELNPLLFNGETLKPEVLDAFLEIADKFKQTLKISINPVDVYFTGSNANYNYNENSDIDIHLVYDFEKVGIAAEILEKYLRDAKRLFNLDYSDIKVKGIKVEVGYENLATPLVATAIYSLRNNNWVKKPEAKATEIQDADTDTYNEITSKIENAIQNKDLNTLESLWKEIGELRKQSLNLEGEFGKGNALFKKLRNLGAIGRLRDAYYKAASEDLSLESKENTNE